MPAEHTQSPIFTEHWYRGCVRCTCAVLPGVGQLWGHHTRAFAFQQLPGLRAGLETEAQPLCPGAFSKKLLIKNAGEPLGGEGVCTLRQKAWNSPKCQGGAGEPQPVPV